MKIVIDEDGDLLWLGQTGLVAMAPKIFFPPTTMETGDTIVKKGGDDLYVRATNSSWTYMGWLSTSGVAEITFDSKLS